MRAPKKEAATMRVIPVLDILDGRVVRGIGGDRARYRPIETRLAASTEPVAVARGLAGVVALDALYVADLDAIAGRPPNRAAFDALAEAFPKTDLWIDAGIATLADWRAWAARPRCVPVVGTETLADTALLRDPAFRRDGVLSLDEKAGIPLGDAAIFETPDLWPARVVAMTLSRVGRGAGPDFSRLAAIRAAAGPARAVYAAGGVRGPHDIAALERAGIAGALVSTALHDGRLGAASMAGDT